MKRGFTLIEAVVYIALLGIILTGAVLTSYQLMEGNTNANANTTVQDEGSFVVRKLEWALSGASSVAAAGSTLTVSRYDGNTITFRLSGTAVQEKESAGGAVFTPITTANVTVQSFLVQVTASGPIKVVATTTIKSIGTQTPVSFVLNKYLRQ